MSQHESRLRLLDATLTVVRSKGYTATRVEDVCAEARLTKGSFFHHFKSKDDLGLAAAALWSTRVEELFGDAAYHQLTEPRDRLLAYVDLRKELIAGAFSQFTCFAGTTLQEAYATHPEIAAACADSILSHARTLEADIAAATRAAGGEPDFTPESLARHTQTVIQGAFILAKATGDVATALESLDHLRRYLELLFPERGPTRAASAED